jgi:hypothetical protein
VTPLAWFLVVVVMALVAATIYEMRRTRVAIRQDSTEAASDRKLARELLATVKGWTLVVEAKDVRKEEKIEQVAKVAAQNAAEVKAAVASVADAVVEKIQAVAAGDSAVLKTRPSEGQS